MKWIFKILCLVSLSIVFSSAVAQDIHTTQYWANPLTTNPALTGFFENNYRIAAIYRNQWFHSKSYSHIQASVDVNFFRKKFNGSFIGVGLSFSNEMEGNGTFQNTIALLSFAYNKMIATNMLKHHVSVGFNTNYTIREFNFQELIYGNKFEKNSNFDPIDATNYKANSYMDLGVGVNYVINLDDLNKIGFGFSVNNLLEQLKDYQRYVNTISYRKFTFLLNAELKLSRSFHLIPIANFQMQGAHNKFIFGSYVKYKLSEYKSNALFVGVQYRISSYEKTLLGSDAIILGFRTIVSNFDIGLSYDFTVSSLSKSNVLVGAPEIAISYSFSNKKSNRLNCPSF